MASPFRTFIDNYDVVNRGDVVSVAVAAPVRNDHRVIIDLSQDDSDNDAMSVDSIVEIPDSPVLAERPIQQHMDVDRFAQLLINEENNHPPLSNTPNATANTYTTTSAAFVAHPPEPQSTTSASAAAENNGESNERHGGARRRNRTNRSHRDFEYHNSSAPTPLNVPISNSQSAQLESTHGHTSIYHHLRNHQLPESIPTHHDPHQQRTRVISDINNTYQSATVVTNIVQSRTGVHISTELRHSPTRNSNNQQRNNASRSNNRRSANVGVAVARGRNPAIHQQQHRLFSIVHQISQDQQRDRHDGVRNNHPHHPGNNIGGLLLNLDNLSYDDMLSMFGNGNENCGAAITDISMLPVTTVTKNDVITTESAVDSTGNQENANKYCCSVCLENYSIDEQKKILPCFHNFHENCIDQWLLQNGSCPICKHRISDCCIDTQHY